MMSKTGLLAMCLTLVTSLGALTGEAAAQGKKKLQVYILAGQSNMVGHASYLTIPALLTSQRPEDRQLAKWVFKEDGIAPGAARELLEIRIQRDKLAGEL